MSIGPDPGDDRRPPLTPALALRVAIVGSVVLALFAIVFFRLWFLQVLTGNQYVRAASVNRTRDVPIAPPRGEILDRTGHQVLVNSRKALALKIVPSELPVPISTENVLHPPRRDSAVYDRLAALLHMSTARHHCTVPIPPPTCTTRHCPHNSTVRLSKIGCTVASQVALATYADVTIRSPVSSDLEYYVAERQNRYKGVEVQQTSITGYPDTTLAAQTLGTVGPITAAQLHSKTFRGVNRNAVIGQTGLEYEYDNYLRGKFGEQKIQIDASGEPTGRGRTIAPTAGHNLQTTLDAPLQRVGQQALTESMGQNASPGGAFVAMDPQDGSVYAMGSEPSFNPSILRNISQRHYEQLNSEAAGQPLLNRATQSVGPTGSTFKPITATAALQSGNWSLDDTYTDNGQYCFGTSGTCLHNAGNAHYGTLNLTNAIKVSDDVFFYNLGDRLNVDRPSGGALQQWARRYGIGRSSGIDLPAAQDGNLPDPAWRAARNREELECEHATGIYRYVDKAGRASATPKPGYHRRARSSSCGIADGRPWSAGDNVNLAVGQGDVQVSPLQLAVAYSALANGGTIVRPHLGLSVQTPDGTVLQKLTPPPSRKLNINPLYLSAITEGLHEAAQGGGTSSDVMGTFPQTVYGKTGTAQYGVGVAGQTETDYAWYACYVPASATSKPIVVVVWVEKGGFGDVAAAPVARQLLSQWFYGKSGSYTAGTSSDQ